MSCIKILPTYLWYKPKPHLTVIKVPIIYNWHIMTQKEYRVQKTGPKLLSRAEINVYRNSFLEYSGRIIRVDYHTETNMNIFITYKFELIENW